MKRRPIAVTWADHYHVNAGKWTDLDGIDTLTPCAVVTCGFLVDETDDVLVVAQSITEADDATGVFVILKSCVKKVKRL